MREAVDKEVFHCALEGELDLHTAPLARSRLDAWLEETGALRLILDLTQVSFLDSSGIGVILGRYRKLQERGGRVEILAPGGAVKKVLEMAGIAGIIPIREAQTKEGFASVHAPVALGEGKEQTSGETFDAQFTAKGGSRAMKEKSS